LAFGPGSSSSPRWRGLRRRRRRLRVFVQVQLEVAAGSGCGAADLVAVDLFFSGRPWWRGEKAWSSGALFCGGSDAVLRRGFSGRPWRRGELPLKLCRLQVVVACCTPRVAGEAMSLAACVGVPVLRPRRRRIVVSSSGAAGLVRWCVGGPSSSSSPLCCSGDGGGGGDSVLLRFDASSSCGPATAEGGDFPSARRPAAESLVSSAPGGSGGAGAAARLHPASECAERRAPRDPFVIFEFSGVLCNAEFY